LENNPEAGFIYRLLAMFKVQAGHVQEGRQMFAKWIEGYPTRLKNVRYFSSGYNFKDLETTKSFAEGFVKAGLPGEPNDFYKIASENKLTDDELKGLFLGHKLTGITLSTGKQWWVERSKTGKASIREGDKSDTGKSWVEDDMLCDKWDNFYEGLSDCWVIYRNPEGTPENHDEYLGAPGYGIYPFSIVE